MTDDQNVVQVRVQVIDVRSNTLDLQLPTYLPARDLTQRVARDAGLDAFWSNGKRRQYWLRARGRLMQPEEKLSDMGVINGELVYLLPQPPDGTVIEQVPEYPETRDYAGAGYPALFGTLALTALWAIAWGFVLADDRDIDLATTLPGIALGFMCASLSRHTFGGRGDQVRVVLLALFFQIGLSILTLTSPFIAHYATWVTEGHAPVGEVPSPLLVYRNGAPGIILGMVGVMAGWLAWWGAVEPLPPQEDRRVEEDQQSVKLPACGICGLEVQPNVQLGCPFACGKVFHKGCHAARLAVYHGSAARCAVCNKGVV